MGYDQSVCEGSFLMSVSAVGYAESYEKKSLLTKTLGESALIESCKHLITWKQRHHTNTFCKISYVFYRG